MDNGLDLDLLEVYSMITCISCETPFCCMDKAWQHSLMTGHRDVWIKNEPFYLHHEDHGGSYAEPVNTQPIIMEGYERESK